MSEESSSRGSDFWRTLAQRKDRKEAQRKLEERYRTLVEQAPIAIVVHMETRIVYANARAVAALGATSPDDLKNRSIWDCIDQDYRQIVAERIETIYDQESHVPVTERRQAQEQLRQSETLHQTLVEEINDVIYTLDEQGRITYISPVVERVSEYKPDDLIGKPFVHFVHPDDRDFLLKSYQRTRSGVQEPYEFRILDKQGSIRFVRSLSRLITENEQPAGVRGVLVDITERKKNEQERERLIGELEAKNAELERFTYTVSHDLKSPLVTIKGFLGLLEKDVLTGNAEQIKQDISQIQGAADKMQRLLEELLELSRIGRLMNPPERASLTDLAREAALLADGQITERGVAVVIAPDMPAVYGDRVRLLQIFQNLLGNAVKFMGDQPEPRIEIAAATRDAEVVCSVRDNGMGIAPKYHDKVFGLFEQIYPDGDGTGIGLTLVKRIVEVHGGAIELASEGEGCGCTFTFSLPLG